MTERAASLKLSVKAQGARAGLRDLRKDAERDAKRMGDAFRRHMSAGLKGGLDSIKAGFSGLKTFVAGLGLFAGLPGLKDGIQHAIQMESRYRKLAFAMQAGTGVATRWRDVQREIQGLAVETGQKTEDLADGFSDLFTKSGDAKFTSSAMRDIAKASTASGHSIGELVEIVDATNAAFGVTSEQVPETLASMISLANKSGLSMADFAAKLELVGVSAKNAGLVGVDGMHKTAAVMAMADASAGGLKKGMAGAIGLLDMLGNKAERAKVLVKLGIDGKAAKGDAIDTIGRILAKTGGKKEKLEAAFGGAQLKILSDLGASYAEVFAATEGDVKTKTAAALDAYRAAVDKAGKSSLTVEQLNEQFAHEMQSTEKQIQVSLTKLEQAFARPEITDAITKLAKHLPALAEGFAKLTGFAVENPAMAAAGGIALMGAKGFLEASITSAFARGAAGAAPMLMQGIAGSAPGLAAGFGSALGPIGIVMGLAAAAILYKTYQEIKEQEEQRRATGKEATRILDADRQNINEVLRQQGIDVDPLGGMSPEMARRMTATQQEGDKIEAAVAASRARGLGLTPEQQARLLSKFGGESVPQFSGVGPNASVDAAAAARGPAVPRFSPAPQSLDQLASRELRVRVVNPKEIGGPAAAAPSGGLVLPPGWMPR